MMTSSWTGGRLRKSGCTGYKISHQEYRANRLFGYFTKLWEGAFQDLKRGWIPDWDSLTMRGDFSKGQWQRVAIARLLAKKDAGIWILDEPTAYLDPLSEIEVYNMIYRLAGKRIVIFISHRLGFAAQTDRILVFDRGEIVEQGEHEELMRREGGLYREMYSLQREWYV